MTSKPGGIPGSRILPSSPSKATRESLRISKGLKSPSVGGVLLFCTRFNLPVGSIRTLLSVHCAITFVQSTEWCSGVQGSFDGAWSTPNHIKPFYICNYDSICATSRFVDTTIFLLSLLCIYQCSDAMVGAFLFFESEGESFSSRIM